MKVHVLERTQGVAAPLDEVFPFFAAPANLGVITPPGMGFRILTPPPLVMKEGAVIDYVVTVGGLPMRWRTLITGYDPPHRFVDEQIMGPYSFWHHTHTFAPRPDGGTDLGDVVRYALPLGPLGDLVHALAVRRQIEGIFRYRREVIAQRFGLAGENA
jgi:ligand-binding SRPBCC domain-containing protein